MFPGFGLGGGMNPKNLEKMMRQLGMKTEQVEAIKVVVETQDKRLVFENPNLTRISVKGQETFQLQGPYEEIPKLREEDIKLVAEKANVSEEKARKALEDTGDITEAILKLKSSC